MESNRECSSALSKSTPRKKSPKYRRKEDDRVLNEGVDFGRETAEQDVKGDGELEGLDWEEEDVSSGELDQGIYRGRRKWVDWGREGDFGERRNGRRKGRRGECCEVSALEEDGLQYK